MKKIMFNDKYGLTQAVLEGRKTMTRRVVTGVQLDYIRKGMPGMAVVESRFKVDEVVAVAQSYGDILRNMTSIDYTDERFNPILSKGPHLESEAGWTNKMFVRADLMPFQIRITNVRVERLQDISDEDVYKEGFCKETVNNGWGNYAHHWEAILVYYDSRGRSKEIRDRNPREAFAALIDKVSGKGTWERNPYVFVYEFELVK